MIRVLIRNRQMAIQNFPSVRIFVFRKTMKFLFTLQTQVQQFPYIFLEKVLN